MRHVAEIDVEAAEYALRRAEALADSVVESARLRRLAAAMAECRAVAPAAAAVAAEEAALRAAPCRAKAPGACEEDGGEWACAPCRARRRA